MKCECTSNRPITQMLMVRFTLVPWFLEIHWEALGRKVTPLNIGIENTAGVWRRSYRPTYHFLCARALQIEDYKQQIVLVKSWNAYSLTTDSHPPSKNNISLPLEPGSFLKTVSKLTHSLCCLHPVVGGSAWSQPYIPRNWIVSFP